MKILMIPCRLLLDVNECVCDLLPRRLNGHIASHEFGTVISALSSDEKKTKISLDLLYATPTQGIGLELIIRPPLSERREPKRINGSRCGYIEKKPRYDNDILIPIYLYGNNMNNKNVNKIKMESNIVWAVNNWATF